MPADAYGWMLAGVSVNLIVLGVDRSLPFYTGVRGLRALYHDADFAALAGPGGAQPMLQADHTYEAMLVAPRLAGTAAGSRGAGVEIRMLGIAPHSVRARAEAVGDRVQVPAADFPHGWRDCHVEDSDGYVWAVGAAG